MSPSGVCATANVQRGCLAGTDRDDRLPARAVTLVPLTPSQESSSDSDETSRGECDSVTSVSTVGSSPLFLDAGDFWLCSRHVALDERLFAAALRVAARRSQRRLGVRICGVWLVTVRLSGLPSGQRPMAVLRGPGGVRRSVPARALTIAKARFGLYRRRRVRWRILSDRRVLGVETRWASAVMGVHDRRAHGELVAER